MAGSKLRLPQRGTSPAPSGSVVGGKVIKKVLQQEFLKASRFGSTKNCSVVDPWHFGTDPDQRIRVSDKWIRILLFSSLTFKTQNFSAYYFLKLHLHHLSKTKSHKEVTKQ
jgi:hypothetical protein